MSLFPEWEAAQLAKAKAHPERIMYMWRMYGFSEGHTCGQCAFFHRYHMGGRWAKCDKTRQTNGKGTDWRSRWSACGLFEGTGDAVITYG